MITRRPTDRRSGRRPRFATLLPLSATLVIVFGLAPVAGVDAAQPIGADRSGAIRSTIQYDEAVAHADDKIAFAPGGRVEVAFTPRRSDRWAVGGVQPRKLPAGRATGKALREAVQPLSAAPADLPLDDPSIAPDDAPATVPVGPIDAPTVDPADAPIVDLAATVDPGGLRREVFGFLPYWELIDSSTTLDWEKLSTIAYFGVGASANGDLQRKNADGTTTVGWSGWTSSRLTSVIDEAHANGTRVVLTVQSFAWNSSGVTRQRALLGSAANRLNLARQIASAVRDRGADGVNLDFEPIAATYGDEFTALVRTVRAELDKVASGYQLTFDTTGWIGNYPIEDATAAGGADAIVIMGYDYKNGSSARVGSVGPVGGPSYDIGDTLAAYLSRVPASKLILGVPYYGRAWSTDSPALNARNISSSRYGASTTVVYGTAQDFGTQYGQAYDPLEGVAWTAYRRENCTTTYGCVTPWRQLYYDDAQALGAKYDLINRYDLRGAAIWALGYDGTRTELYQVLADKFITDTIPPQISASTISSGLVSPDGDGRLDTVTVSLTVTGLVEYGWLVEPFFDGIAGPAVSSGSAPGKSAAYTWDGKAADGSGLPDGPYRITIWTADASNNRAQIQEIVTLDGTPAIVGSSASRVWISPDGDRRADTTTLRMTADSPLTGVGRVMTKTGLTVRRWTFSQSQAAVWTWDGRDSSGRYVPDASYVFRVAGTDPAGNQTITDITVRVDKTIRSLTWRSPAFRPKALQRDRLAFTLSRSAKVTVRIYRGATLVRTIWTDRTLAAGRHGWTWNGRSSSGALVAAGTYVAIVDATSRIGPSRMTRTVTVRP